MTKAVRGRNPLSWMTVKTFDEHPNFSRNGFDREFLASIARAEEEHLPYREDIKGSFKETFNQGKGKAQVPMTERIRRELKLDRHLRSSEDLTFGNNSALYSKTTAGIVDQAFRPELIATGAMRKFQGNMKGTSHIEVPKNSLLTASELNADASVSYADNDYTSADLEYKWYVCAVKVTKQLLEHSMVDLIADQLSLAGQALAQKSDTTTLSAWETATPSNDSESNYEALGGTTDLGFAKLEDALASYKESFPGVKMSHIVTNPTTYRTFRQDAQIKAMMAAGGNQKRPGHFGIETTEYGNMTIVENPQVSAKTTFIVASPQLGYYVDGGPVETYDARIAGSVAWEVIAVKPWAVKVVRPGALYRIMDNTS